MIAIDSSVKPGDGYISYSNVSFVATTNSYVVSLFHINDVNNSNVLKGHTF